MTPNKAIHALARPYTGADRIVFDANILVSLFSGIEPPGSVIVANYSARSWQSAEKLHNHRAWQAKSA